MDSDIDGNTLYSEDAGALDIATRKVSNNCSSIDQNMDTNQVMDTTTAIECESQCISSDNVKITTAKFILTLKERFKLTQVIT